MTADAGHEGQDNEGCAAQHRGDAQYFYTAPGQRWSSRRLSTPLPFVPALFGLVCDWFLLQRAQQQRSWPRLLEPLALFQYGAESPLVLHNQRLEQAPNARLEGEQGVLQQK